MTLRDRIGVDVGRKLRIEDALAWAAEHRVRFVDVQLDTGANALGTIDTARAAAVRAGCERHGIRLGLHTASAVNVAEYAPLIGEAVDRYLEAYIDAASLLGAGWVVVHAGFHFTSDRDERMPWSGHPAKTSESEGWVFNVARFYDHYLHNYRIHQGEDGSLQEILPPYWTFNSKDIIWPSVITPRTASTAHQA